MAPGASAGSGGDSAATSDDAAATGAADPGESSAANLANDPEVRRNAARKPTNAFVVLLALSVLV